MEITLSHAIKESVSLSIPEATPLAAAAAVLAVGVLPTYLGLVFPRLIGRKSGEGSAPLAASLATGISFALFFDLVSDASGLGLNLGSKASGTQLTLVGSFVFGILLLFSLESRSEKQSLPFSLAYVMAFGIGFHSFAEGIIVGYDIRTTGLPEDLGTAVQGLSFALHKAGEGFVIASLFLRRIGWGNIAVAGAVASLPGALGAILGAIAIPGVIGSYFFAMGAGASIFIIAKLIPVAFSGKSNLMAGIGIAAGYLFIYGAGLIHTL